MRRSTIRDLAEAAGVSMATANRVLSSSDRVRIQTREKVEAIARKMGFIGVDATQPRNRARVKEYRLGFILPPPERPFYQRLAQALEASAMVSPEKVKLKVVHLENMSEQNVSSRALALAEICDAIAVTSTIHPLLATAFEVIHTQGVPVFALISQLSESGLVHYVGLDNWKVGRTAAWAIENISKKPGKIAIVHDDRRFRDHEIIEAGLRSYFREYGTGFTLLEPYATSGSPAIAQEITERLLNDHGDLAGLFISGDGVGGALAALRQSGRAAKVAVIGFGALESVRAVLVDRTLALAITYPIRRVADEAISGMVNCVDSQSERRWWDRVVPFEIYTPENI